MISQWKDIHFAQPFHIWHPPLKKKSLGVYFDIVVFSELHRFHIDLEGGIPTYIYSELLSMHNRHRTFR